MNLSPMAVDVQVDAVAKLLDGGWIDVCAGPLLLSTHRLADPAFGKSANGRIEAYPIEIGEATADGTADGYRCYMADHQTLVADGPVGRLRQGATEELLLKSVKLAEGIEVAITRFVLTRPK